MDDRFTIANMAIEAGAKNGIFPVDARTRAYLKGRVDRPWEAVEPDADAVYEREVIIDLSALRPTVSLPHLPSNTKTVDEAAGMSIQQVVIGSCTNGRLKDLQEAADVLKGRQVAKGRTLHRHPGYPADLYGRHGPGPHPDLYRVRLCRIHPYLRTLPGRPYGCAGGR